MDVTLFMAISANGIIARPDFREDFLSRRNWDSFIEAVTETGALVWGRNTHEKFRGYGPRLFEDLAGFHNVVVSTRADFTAAEPGFEVAASPRQALERLAARGCTRATLAGGSILNRAFAGERLIRSITLNVEAVVVGRGIPLFAPGDFDLQLRLESVRQVDERIVQIRYVVLDA